MFSIKFGTDLFYFNLLLYKIFFNCKRSWNISLLSNVKNCLRVFIIFSLIQTPRTRYFLAWVNMTLPTCFAWQEYFLNNIYTMQIKSLSYLWPERNRGCLPGAKKLERLPWCASIFSITIRNHIFLKWFLHRRSFVRGVITCITVKETLSTKHYWVWRALKKIYKWTSNETLTAVLENKWAEITFIVSNLLPFLLCLSFFL